MVEAALTARATTLASGFGDAPAARTVQAAMDRSNANIVLVSTPGRYAFTDAIDTLDSDVSVIVFSDNVPLDREIGSSRKRAGVGCW
jgi:FdrA protein